MKNQSDRLETGDTMEVPEPAGAADRMIPSAVLRSRL
jgi:hypothetical protein